MGSALCYPSSSRHGRSVLHLRILRELTEPWRLLSRRHLVYQKQHHHRKPDQRHAASSPIHPRFSVNTSRFTGTEFRYCDAAGCLGGMGSLDDCGLAHWHRGFCTVGGRWGRHGNVACRDQPQHPRLAQNARIADGRRYRQDPGPTGSREDRDTLVTILGCPSFAVEPALSSVIRRIVPSSHGRRTARGQSCPHPTCQRSIEKLSTGPRVGIGHRCQA